MLHLAYDLATEADDNILLATAKTEANEKTQEAQLRIEESRRLEAIERAKSILLAVDASFKPTRDRLDIDWSVLHVAEQRVFAAQCRSQASAFETALNDLASLSGAIILPVLFLSI
jgi:hypothetical protein